MYILHLSRKIPRGKTRRNYGIMKVGQLPGRVRRRIARPAGCNARPVRKYELVTVLADN
jgi:hypothetical protein